MKKSMNLSAFNVTILFIFFIVIEWRWQIELLGFRVFNPYYLVVFLSFLLTIITITNIIVSHKKTSLLSVFIFVFIFYCFLIFVVNIPEIALYDHIYIYTRFGIWPINFALFFIGMNEYIWLMFEKHPYYMLSIFLLFISGPVIILVFSEGASKANYSLRSLLYILDISKDESHGVSYQSFGLKISLFAFLILSIIKSDYLKLLVLVISIILLYIVGSKASILGLVFAVVAYMIIILLHEKQYIKILVCAAFVILLAMVGYHFLVNDADLQESENWIVKSFASGTEDGSLTSRKQIQEMNQNHRNANYVLGDYAFDLKLGRNGSGTHNATNYIENYGIVPFITFVLIWCYILFRLISYKGERTVVIHCASMSMLFFSPLVCLAYAGQNYLNYFVFGYAVAAIDSMDMAKSPLPLNCQRRHKNGPNAG